MTRHAQRTPRPRDTTWAVACLLFLALLASIVACAWLSQPVYRHVGPWLAGRPLWQQVLLGAAAGLAAFLPLLPLAAARGRLRKALIYPAGWAAFTGVLFLATVGMPPRRSSWFPLFPNDASVLRSQAGWAWATAALVAMALLLGGLALVAARVRPAPQGAPSRPGRPHPRARRRRRRR